MTDATNAARAAGLLTSEDPTVPTRPRMLSRSRLVPWPVHPMVLAPYPVLVLFAGNQAEVAFGETLEPILGALLAVTLITLVAGVLLRDLRRGALLATLLLVTWFTFFQVQQIIGPLGIHPNVQVALTFGLVVLLGYLIIRMPVLAVARASMALDVTAAVLLAMTVVQIVPYQLEHQVALAGDGRAAVVRGSPAPGSRDIYFLVFDRYGSDESMRDITGIDNDLTDWLDQQGFEVARDGLANYGRTTLSLAATLNMTHLEDLAARVGPDTNDTSAVNDMLQDHQVGRFLQSRGYRYIHIGSWFGPTKTIGIADENPVLPGSSDFLGLLDTTTLASTIDLLRGVPPNHNRLHRAAALFDFDEFEQVRAETGPKFVMMHILLPHEPYVFRADGSYSGLTGDEAILSPEGLRDQLEFTNGHIRQMVSELLAVPEAERPIVIIEADEGPYPERFASNQDGFDWQDATPEELETKYGVMLAMYLPGEAPAGAPAMYDDMTLINTFPLLFDRYFDADIPLLPDRSFSSERWRRPFDLTDITERLAGT